MEKRKSIKPVLIIIGIVIVFVLLCVFGFNVVKNKAIGYEEQITTAKSEITIQEKRRADLIPNLVDCVKEYDKHEYETLMSIVEHRNMDGFEATEEIKTKIMAVAEAYPELKSSENYKQLMTELSVTENKIASTRNSYNSWVTQYNTYCRKFPNSFILSFLGYEKADFEKLTFDISEEEVTNLFGD